MTVETIRSEPGFADFNGPGAPVVRPQPGADNLAQVSDLLALTQRIATPFGWKSLADLTIGHFVYDGRGKPQRVVMATPVFKDLKCYEVTFDDGQEVTVSASHRWTVETRNGHDDGFVEVTVSAEELARMKGNRRSAISIPNGVRLSDDIGLPVDPYLFGYWLGDGYAANGAIAVGRQDIEEVTSLLVGTMRPYETMSSVYYDYNLSHFLNIRNIKKPSRDAIDQSLFQRLRTLGVLRNKHVPDLYLFAGTEQRRALLQGMVDSDGSVTPKKGQIHFTNTNRRIIEGFVEIARSLGYKPSVRDHCTSGSVAVFQVADGKPIARIGRKQARVIPGGRIASRRYIRSVVPVESVPLKGLGIETGSQSFQVEGGILTRGF
ncbi:LAGLIDADG family homing endonuclease [Arthrobacter sp. efr-133-TYG-120]|uniref:LAGLIDADG family homing endonuclease n=1 Tax=Arthrobacter sp. efr-133-TYG-120 TaxID=3040280 RepID=UPI00254BCE86|nr:LAGLIDADG family homing endonuclease [Arthrobacter sp. efr-133-TYG-120]